MNRSTVYNKITSPELLDQIAEENKILAQDFLTYLEATDKSPNTIYQYKQDLNVFFVYNLQRNQNKKFVDITKRDLTTFQNFALNEWRWSPNRIGRLKSVISSLSRYVENILDEEEEYRGFHSIIKKIESPPMKVVREKTVLTMEDVQHLLDVLMSKEQYMKACFVSLAVNSGRRKAEIPRFRASWFSDENVMFGSLYKTPVKVQTKGRGSQGKLLTLYTFKNEFDPYLNKWIEKRKELGITSDYLFPAKYDGVYVDEPLPTYIVDSWTPQFSKIIDKPFYMHSLRHFWTTNALRHNLPVNVVQRLSGWESAEMVSKYDDSTDEEIFEMYFDENGIKKIDPLKNQLT